VLLKPSGELGSQVVVRGQVWGQLSALDYHRRRVEELFPIVVESLERLRRTYDVVILEGAGSPAEINLQARDITNLRVARAAEAPCLLVGDIDRGGVFASLVGTLALLEEDERAMVRGFLINKFRGSLELLEPGARKVEARLDRPCLGGVPFLPNLELDEEDSVSLEDVTTDTSSWSRASGAGRPLRVAVVALPHLANFTDFGALASEPSVALAYVRRPEALSEADLVILPGSKQTLDDLAWLHETAFAEALERQREAGGLVLGICGGMQMLGKEITDIEGLEGGGSAPGLGFLPIRTELSGRKTTVPARGRLLVPELFGLPVDDDAPEGYEIHLGATTYDGDARALCLIERAGSSGLFEDGARSEDDRVVGTYLHGFLDRDRFRHGFLGAARAACGLSPTSARRAYTVEREARYDRLAANVERVVDVSRLLAWLGLS